MAPVTGTSNKPTLASTRRPHIAPVVPLIYDKKKDEENTSQPNGSLNGNGGGNPSLSQNGHASVGPAPVAPAPVASAAAVAPIAHLPASNGSADSRTVVAAPNGHPRADPFALSEPVERNGPAVPISNTANLNGSTHQRFPAVDGPLTPIRPPHPSYIPYEINGHNARLSNGHRAHLSNGHRAHLSNGSFARNGNQYSTEIFPMFLTGSDFDAPSAVGGGSNGPLTPGSFHGSHSSRLPDDVYLGRFPVVRGQEPISMPNGHSPMVPNNPMAVSHIVEQGPSHEADTLHYLRSGALMYNYNDCYVELHFPVPHAHYRDHPDSVRLKRVLMVPAHRFILASSGAFRRAMEEKELAPGGVLVYHLGDKYMRSDVVHAAIRTMYGWSLGEGIPETALVVRDARDDMMLALSYMAVGLDLQLSRVFRYAMRRAINLLSWETVDLALGFALHHLARPHRSGGPCGLEELMSNVLGFIIVEFPHDFVLDVNVGDGEFCRLPREGTSPAGSSHSSATGSSMPSGQRPSNPELQNIRFGDLSEQNGHGPAGLAAGPGPAPRRAPGGLNTVLSHIVLNLPYELLKDVLESDNLGRANLERANLRMASPDLAQHLPIEEIIAEREARRKRALSRAGPELLSALERAVAPPVGNGQQDSYVNALGFKEEVCFGDGPFLLHTWIGSLPGSDAA